EDMNQIMVTNLREGYGSGVVLDENRDGCLWMQFSTHLYRNFYNYQYTTGIAGAHALAAGVLGKKPEAVENYFSFQKAGGSLYPLDALKMAGVDLSTPEPVHQAFHDLDGYITELEKLLM
ncbi:MAG: M3 family metallopeptidase, partial [Anaerolineaceae bacterium]